MSESYGKTHQNIKKIKEVIPSVPLKRDKILANSILLMEKERQIPEQAHDKDSTFTLLINSYVSLNSDDQ